MGGLFGKPKTPQVVMPPPTPVVDESAKERSERDALARRRGRRATVIAGAAGAPKTASKTLLGS